MRFQSLILVTLLAALVVGGCQRRAKRDVSAATGQPPIQAPQADGPRESAGQMALNVYEITLPAGALTQADELWNPVNEQALDVAIYDVLWANGIRAGIGPASELGDLAAVLGSTQAPMRTVIPPPNLSRQTYRIERSRGPVGEQTLFWFDQRKQHHGRTFIASSNTLHVEFAPAPGQLDRAQRVTITPMIRSSRGRTEVRPDGEDYEIVQVFDEAAFDLNLTADVQMGQFLLIAPSPDAQLSTSLGRAFLMGHVDGRPTETAYLLVPTRVTLQRQ